MLRRYHLIRALTAMTAAFSAITPWSEARAQSNAVPTPSEARAHFLGNLIKSTDWPKDAFADENAPFVLGILGKDPFGESLDIIVKVYGTKGRKLEVKHFSKAPQVEGCHLLFISSSEEARLAEILKTLAKPGLLTVAELTVPDVQKSNDRNGMVYFAIEEIKPGVGIPRFNINPDTVEKAKLRMPSQLYEIAKKYWR